MTVSSETNKVTYTCNGVTSVFSGTFKILDDDEVLVQNRVTATGAYTTLIKTTDYTVSGVGDDAGFTVTLVDPATDAATGTKLILTRNMPDTQELDLAEYDNFSAESVEEAFDRGVMKSQQQQEQIDRSIKWDSSISGVSATITGTPAALDSLRVNSTGTGLEFATFSSTGDYAFGAGVGFLAQTATGNATPRTLTGTANEITVTNGTGAAGNPVLSLPTALTFTGKTVTGGTYASGTYSGTLTVSGMFANTSLRVADTNASHALIVKPGSDLTADRTFNIITGDSDRTLTISGNPTLSTTPITRIVRQQFTSSGTYTPTTGMVYCILHTVGGGGAGGSVADSSGNGCGGGGGSGGYSVKRATASDIGVSKTVTIGAGGTAAAGGNNPGGNGGDTSVGTLCIGKGGTGGSGGAANSSGAGGSPGVVGTGDTTLPGGSGQRGSSGTIATVAFGQPMGGITVLGGCGGTSAGQAAGVAGQANTGAGGSGGSSFNSGGAAGGGAGGSGYVWVEEFIAE